MFSLSQTQNSLTVAWNEQQVLGYHFPRRRQPPLLSPVELAWCAATYDERTR